MEVKKHEIRISKKPADPDHMPITNKIVNLDGALKKLNEWLEVVHPVKLINISYDKESLIIWYLNEE